ncbi:hypothetical protein JW826_06180 [Candidatus Woesearchaeota archaeon]|nr:hypothetical protein [Candidatus Woesearchaeota archaeon]
MIVAISAYGEDLDSDIDLRFGRCKYFLVVDVEGKKIVKTEAVLNAGAEQGHGAGIKAAEQMGKLRVDNLLTGELGPNATAVLDKLKVKAYRASGKAKDALGQFLNGGLEQISEVAEPHHELSERAVGGGERIFFPLLDNNGEDSEISSHFGHAPFFGVYDVDKKELKIIGNDLDHVDPAKSPIDQIEDAVHPTTIFAKGIGGRAIGLIAAKGLLLKTGDYATVKEVLHNLDKLENQTKDCGHKH